jgi:activator of HSP90 ATPase
MAPKQAPSSKVLDTTPEITVKSLPSLIPTMETKPVTKSKPRTISITQKEKFTCQPRDLFECLIEPNRVKAYAGGDAEMSGEKGGKFKLFGGSVTGENITVVKLPF